MLHLRYVLRLAVAGGDLGLGFQKVGKIQLSKSGRAVEIVLDKLPYTQFTSYLYVPKAKVKQILEDKLGFTSVSLLTKRGES